MRRAAVRAKWRSALDLQGRYRLLAVLESAASSLNYRRPVWITKTGSYWFIRSLGSATVVSNTYMWRGPAFWRTLTEDLLFYLHRPGEGDVVVDVGAGMGEELPYLSHSVGRSGRVIAVEAHPFTYGGLLRAISANQLENCEPVWAAISDETGTAVLSDLQDLDANTTVARPVGEAQVEVPAFTLDDMAARMSIDRVDLLKMNIEGAERFAIRGATRVLHQTGHVVISCHDFLADELGDESLRTKEVIMTALSAAGFEIETRDDDRAFVADYVYGKRNPAVRRGVRAERSKRYRTVRARGGKMLRRVGLRPASPPPWIVAQAPPVNSVPLDEIRLFAIIGAWMEQDVVASTVANALTQGCERVYLVDNDSSDDTVREAVAAGALLEESFSTDVYDERRRLEVMNAVVQRVSVAERSAHIWWLWLDADEFPHGPRGMTIIDYLRTLDRSYRIVGARFINHYPSGDPAYIPGFHPLEFQQLCEEHAFGCAQKHRKHPLQRFDRHGSPIVCGPGFHKAESAEHPLREPIEAIFLHHFPYREQAVTRARLGLLCADNERGTTRVRGSEAVDGITARFQTLDAVYRGDWDNVLNYRVHDEYSVVNRFATVRPVPWSSLVGPQDASFARWYSHADLERARSSNP
jgi:FkbM family methyltransferase